MTSYMRYETSPTIKVTKKKIHIVMIKPYHHKVVHTYRYVHRVVTPSAAW